VTAPTLREALDAVRAFLLRLDDVMPAINAAFTFQQLHGMTYEGPTYEKELADLRAALPVLERAVEAQEMRAQDSDAQTLAERVVEDYCRGRVSADLDERMRLANHLRDAITDATAALRARVEELSENERAAPEEKP
jgi:hypothetical protein